MQKNNKLISYAMDFASYLILKSEDINQIILHGSVSRGDFNENSDVDIFIDTNKKNSDKKIDLITENYYKTNKFKEWKLKGIENPFSVIVGGLNDKEWKDLKRAIINTGITLYGKYKENVEKVNQYVVLTFENIKPEKKRVAVHRKLFGFGKGKKRYSGEVEKSKAIRIGKGVILVPVENIKKIKEYLRKKKVQFKIYDFWSDISIN
jgi:predicted nucleotidyltransferase